MPEEIVTSWDSPNVQVMTGAHWRLAVIDLDGPEAVEHWPAMGPCPDTWVSGRDPERSQHLWFRLPVWLPRLASKSRLWGIKEGEDGYGRTLWKRHTAVELLADRKLVIAPPSIHPETGQEYRWLTGPADLPEPATLPDWVMRLPDLDRPPAPRLAPETRPARFLPDDGQRYDRDRVLAAIPDKVALAQSWGLRVADRRAGGICRYCHAIDREDRRPSAMINIRTGCYWSPWVPGGRAFTFFDLAVALGVYPDWQTAVNDLGRRYMAPTS